ncbi:hypothetical protein [Corynebacterium pyruviciproducens]|uniref:Uncharacterized protein n=1 Tax=Corynebacterium pyruviciproducens TaxID=598660 RepID=A0AAF0YT19_9CORY|nr:hypothetical protein [Corynebacterium pyruviciproducens]WOT02882.1 hypothetical protein CYJ47_03685 [Corynebacterium pyruviciproducens]
MNHTTTHGVIFVRVFVLTIGYGVFGCAVLVPVRVRFCASLGHIWRQFVAYLAQVRGFTCAVHGVNHGVSFECCPGNSALCLAALTFACPGAPGVDLFA